MLSPAEIWKSFEVPRDRSISWKIGAIRIRATRIDHDWLLAQEPDDAMETAEISIGDDPIPESLTPQRWAFKSSKNIIRFQPAMPDRPLVVRPISPLGIPPESEVQFFINIPATVQVWVGSTKACVELASFPSQILSNTWFGDQFSGIFCYASKNYIRREKQEIEVIPNQIICPFRIKNKGAELLKVERICLQASHLSIFAAKKRLWSNEVTAIFRGHGRETQLEYARGAPKDAESPELLIKSTEKPDRNFLRHTFAHYAFPRKRD